MHSICTMHYCEVTNSQHMGGAVYSGITSKWDYQKRICDISMPRYVANGLSLYMVQKLSTRLIKACNVQLQSTQEIHHKHLTISQIHN
jgi:hypothetical protein